MWRNSLAQAAAAMLLLAGVATAQSAPDASTLRAIEQEVSDIRGLQPQRSADLQILDRASLSAFLKDEFNKDYLPSERESDQKELVALGLIQPTDNLVQLQLNLLDDQVIGVYDPDVRSLFVVDDDGGGFSPAARITYAHEFSHALQDQYFDLNKIAPKHSDSNDHSLAVHSLIEGDAVMLQTLWAQRNLTEHELAQLARASSGADAGLDAAPMVLRSELLFPYTDGFNFVRQAYRQAGNRYAAVDALFADPPESTAQVLHPDKYAAHLHPVSVDLGDIAGRLGPNWRKVGDGVLGELDTRVLLEQYGTPTAQARSVAAAWTGDHWQLVEGDGHSAIAFKSTWQSPATAVAFFTAYRDGLHTRFGGATLAASSDTHEALTTATYATDLSVLGNDVLAVIASDRDTADAIISSGL